ncbi:hypothetical protein HHI36_019055 [Cryptolaemus montrouzieri]|uniref:Uncharacterized protein n=1 Tax=Cryptolaemus montrouzieri TaxID=559131 RepID=A0ABD2P1T4_9CUCU
MLISPKRKKYIINFGVYTDKDVDISYLDKWKSYQLPLKLLDVNQEDNTLVWTLDEKKVCKNFFLGTLGYTNHEAVQAVLKANLYLEIQVQKLELRQILEDIKSDRLKYKPIHSHYNMNMRLILLPSNRDLMTDIETVILEYFENGHTSMAADTVLAAIIKKFKMTEEVYDFDDFVHNIKTSRKNLEVAVLSHKNMFVFSNDSKVAYPKVSISTTSKLYRLERDILPCLLRMSIKENLEEKRCEKII